MSTNKLHYNVNYILCTIKSHSKEICYELCKDKGYLKTALELSFDTLYERQINNMTGELNHYLIFKSRVVTVKEIIQLEQVYIDMCKHECSMKGLLSYMVDMACRQAFIKAINSYCELKAC